MKILLIVYPKTRVTVLTSISRDNFAEFAKFFGDGVELGLCGCLIEICKWQSSDYESSVLGRKRHAERARENRGRRVGRQVTEVTKHGVGEESENTRDLFSSTWIVGDTTPEIRKQIIGMDITWSNSTLSVLQASIAGAGASNFNFGLHHSRETPGRLQRPAELYMCSYS